MADTWRGNDYGETWKLEVEVDVMEIDGPVVVTVYLECNAPGDPKEAALACVTPAQAREIAAALLTSADLADEQRLLRLLDEANEDEVKRLRESLEAARKKNPASRDRT